MLFKRLATFGCSEPKARSSMSSARLKYMSASSNSPRSRRMLPMLFKELATGIESWPKRFSLTARASFIIENAFE